MKEADTNGALLVTRVTDNHGVEVPTLSTEMECKSIVEATKSEFKKITSKRKRKESTSDATTKPKGIFPLGTTRSKSSLFFLYIYILEAKTHLMQIERNF